MNVKTFISGLYPPLSLLGISMLLLLGDRKKVRMDVERWKKERRLQGLGFYHSLSYLLTWMPEFRNLFYRRLGKIGKILNVFFPGERTLSLTPHEIGGGMYILHGTSTYVNTRSIGINCTVHQNTTIGDNGKGIPTLGDNVFIGTGAVVLGPIHIGNNVIIGAGALIIENVPDNCVVVGEKARIKDLKI